MNRLSGYGESTKEMVDDAAESHRIYFEGLVGDLAEYGLGHVNRTNIDQHYVIGAVIVPRQKGSNDDHCVGLRL